jgi:hypothetical protein
MSQPLTHRHERWTWTIFPAFLLQEITSDNVIVVYTMLAGPEPSTANTTVL